MESAASAGALLAIIHLAKQTSVQLLSAIGSPACTVLR